MQLFARAGRAIRTKSGRASGQALIELALVVPIILLLLMGLIQFALIFERQIGIENAVREAARRAAALAAPDAGVAQTNANWALGQMTTLLGNSQAHEGSRDTIEVCIFTPAPPNNLDPSSNAQVVVRVRETYRHPLFLPIIDLLLDPIDGVSDQSLAVSTSSQFRVEQSGSHDIGAGAYARFPSSTGACAQ